MGLHTPWQKLGRSVTKMLDHNNFAFTVKRLRFLATIIKQKRSG